MRDLPDLALLGTIRSIEAARLRTAIGQTFAFRATHDVPTTLPEPPPEWRDPYASMAAEDSLSWPTLDEVFEAAKAFVEPALELKISRGRIVVTCSDRQGVFADGVAEVVLADDMSVTLRTVKQQANAVDIGVEFELTTTGARLRSVANAAAAAGLKVGDVVTAVNRVPLVGLGAPAVKALAFMVPARSTLTLSIHRGGRSQDIKVSAN